MAGVNADATAAAADATALSVGPAAVGSSARPRLIPPGGIPPLDLRQPHLRGRARSSTRNSDMPLSGSNFYGQFATSSPSTGVAQDADSPPTATATHNGLLDPGFVLTVVNISTGLYAVLGTTIPGGYAVGDWVSISVEATVGGSHGVAVLETFAIESAAAAATPVIGTALATVYCTDEDVAVRAGGDFILLCPKWQSRAYGTDAGRSRRASPGRSRPALPRSRPPGSGPGRSCGSPSPPASTRPAGNSSGSTRHRARTWPCTGSAWRPARAGRRPPPRGSRPSSTPSSRSRPRSRRPPGTSTAATGSTHASGRAGSRPTPTTSATCGRHASSP